LASSCVEKQGKVFAFEPVKSEFKKFKKNILINRSSNIKAEQMALGNKNGAAEIFVCLKGKEAYSSLKKPNVSAPLKKEQCLISTFDKYVEENKIKQVDFIKIDVEGGELDVLKGAVKTLNYFRPFLMCELADIRTKAWGYNASSIYKFLLDYNYLWFKPDKEGNLKRAEIKEKYDPEWENLIAVPQEKFPLINNLIK